MTGTVTAAGVSDVRLSEGIQPSHFLDSEYDALPRNQADPRTRAVQATLLLFGEGPRNRLDDGIRGPATDAAAASARSRRIEELRLGDGYQRQNPERDRDVRTIQRALSRILEREVRVDGDLGSGTLQAINDWRSLHGRPPVSAEDVVFTSDDWQLLLSDSLRKRATGIGPTPARLDNEGEAAELGSDRFVPAPAANDHFPSPSGPLEGSPLTRGLTAPAIQSPPPEAARSPEPLATGEIAPAALPEVEPPEGGYPLFRHGDRGNPVIGHIQTAIAAEGYVRPNGQALDIDNWALGDTRDAVEWLANRIGSEHADSSDPEFWNMMHRYAESGQASDGFVTAFERALAEPPIAAAPRGAVDPAGFELSSLSADGFRHNMPHLPQVNYGTVGSWSNGCLPASRAMVRAVDGGRVGERMWGNQDGYLRVDGARLQRTLGFLSNSPVLTGVRADGRGSASGHVLAIDGFRFTRPGTTQEVPRAEVEAAIEAAGGDWNRLLPSLARANIELQFTHRDPGASQPVAADSFFRVRPDGLVEREAVGPRGVAYGRLTVRYFSV
ncbi:MAG: hypothetical protein AAFQ65_09000 [Myxococcota bacterium]